MKFNKNKCFFASVYVAAVSAMTFTGFTSYAAEQNAQINETLSLISPGAGRESGSTSGRERIDGIADLL